MNRKPIRPDRQCPCNGCGEREIGCHGECEKYRTWKAGEDEINHKRWESNQLYAMSDTKRKWIVKNMKRKR